MPSTPVSLVTGATAGIGRAIADAFASAGHAVAVCARDGDAVDRTVAELRERGVRATGIACDVSDAAQVAALVAHVERQLGPIDVLVNNAAVGILKPFADMSLDEWDRSFAVNVRSLYLVTHAVLPGMRQRRNGFICNIASLAGRNGMKGGTAYSASKHAVLGFSSSLMLEVRHEGVRVVAVCPGSVDTRFGGKATSGDSNWKLKPEDVAHTVMAAMSLPANALMSELDLRPAAPASA